MMHRQEQCKSFFRSAPQCICSFAEVIRRQKAAKQICGATLCLSLLLSACGQTDTQAYDKTTAASRCPATSAASAAAASPQAEPAPDERALYFCGEMPDPQSMAPTYESGTLTFEGTFTQRAEGEYETALRLIRHFPQGINLMTGETRAGGYMNLRYDSTGDAVAAELSAERKKVLDEKSEGDTGQRQYGMLPVRVLNMANFIQTTSSFCLPMDYSRHFSTITELPYLLTTNGDKASLYIQLNPAAAVKLEGSLTIPPLPEKPPLALDMQTLYINDEGHTTEQNKQKDVWNILFLGEKSGDSYCGTMRLWRWRERTGTAPTNLCYVPEDASAYEQAISLTFQPFSEDEYLTAGGKQNARQRAVLTEMATAECGGQKLIFTVCGGTVFAELLQANIGALEGRFTEEKGITRIYEESLALYKLAHIYHLSPLSPMTANMEYSVAQGLQQIQDKNAAALGKEHAEMAWGAPSGVPRFMPDNFFQAFNPTDFLEKRPATLIFGSFQYLDDGYWLDAIGPLYREKLAGMRDLRIEEGETAEGTGYEMEITFRYGERTVGYSLVETSVGTGVMIMIYG